MTVPDSRPRWRKSSWSADQNQCVEVLLDARVGVRDTKDRVGGELVVEPDAWAAFTGSLRS